MASEDPSVPDGLKVDLQGNVFCTGPGGVWVCSPRGERLGRILLPELAANLAWGENGGVLFLTARTSVYRLPTKTRGALLGSPAGEPARHRQRACSPAMRGRGIWRTDHAKNRRRRISRAYYGL